MRLFVPVWTSPEGAYSGGQYRAKRFIETQHAFDLCVADSDTSTVERAKVRGEVRHYAGRHLYARSTLFFATMRIVNWAFSCVRLITLGLSCKDVNAVYVPTSELPHVALAGFIVGKVRGIPIIFCNLNVRGVPLWRLNRLLHQRVTGIITLSGALAKEIRNERINVPILIGSVGVDDGSVQPSEKKFDAIYVARHTAEKGVFDLLSIWRLCCTVNPALQLAMVGPSSAAVKEKLESLIRDYGLAKNIRILGPVTEAEKWRLYAASAVCLFPSHVEGWGIVPIEAHLAGLRVVAYDLGAYAETIRHSPDAVLVKEGDVNGFAASALRLMSLDEGASQTARKWAQKFSWDAATHLEEQLITELLANKQ